MDKLIERGLLFDFYGELLTSHQQKIYSEVVFNDLSLAEVSEEEGISRQGVHDLIKRCDKILDEYEAKLHLIEKFQLINKEVSVLDSTIENADIDTALKESLKLSLKKIIEEL